MGYVRFKENRWGKWITCRDLRVVRGKLQVPPLISPELPVQEIPVRSGRDDKVKGSGTPRHEWRWTDRLVKS